MQPVYRIDAHGEEPIPFPSLKEAMRDGPRHPESYVATNAEGVHLADAFPVRGSGTMLRWRLTIAGQDIIDRGGWTCGAPVLSEEEYEGVLAIALAEDLARSA